MILFELIFVYDVKLKVRAKNFYMNTQMFKHHLKICYTFRIELHWQLCLKN